MKDADSPFRVIEHTADVGLEVWGRDFEEFFMNCAAGFFHLIQKSAAPVGNVVSYTVTIEEKSPDMLFYGFLQELNYIHQSERFIFGSITIDSVSEKRISAVVYGETYNPNVHELILEIKAVTLHGLEAVKTRNGWRGKVLFDI